ncbi:MAG: DUF1080 domain-containing protein [Phycisphaerae bacterium]|jgi:hypothetical protein
MNARLSRLHAVLGSAAVLTLSMTTPGPAALAQTGAAPPALSAAERAAGWRLLFDGNSTAAWRTYRGKAFPDKGWTIDAGCLKTVAAGPKTDIITTDTFGDFELEWEWRVAAKGNSGVMYRVTETYEATWQSGPEYQILDDAGHNYAPDKPGAAGALYDLYPAPASKPLRPVGEFNAARIRLRDGVLQHWLNGVKVVECQLGSEDWKQRVAASKFSAYPEFGAAARGHIALQHHGGDVWFRNVRVRDLEAPMPGEVKLLNGKDLAGWTACLPEGGGMEDVWRVENGVLICKGTPAGYIRTTNDYTNYVLKLEWRFDPVTKRAGNSGVLLRIIGEDKIWPRCVEAQLQSENAGDFWNIDEFPMKTDPARTNGRNTKKLHMAERPVGEWNEYEIIVDHGRIALKVNGELLNEATDVLETPGKIGLQSEGAEIHFRNVRLAPIP